MKGLTRKTRLSRWRIPFLILPLFLCAVLPSAPARSERIAVVVHPSNTEVLSARDVYLIYMGKRTTWGDGRKIMPFDHAQGQWKEAFVKQFLNLNVYQYDEYWLERMVRGEGTEPGKKTPAIVKRLVSKIDSAIGYIPESMVDETVRVILLQ